MSVKNLNCCGVFTRQTKLVPSQYFTPNSATRASGMSTCSNFGRQEFPTDVDFTLKTATLIRVQSMEEALICPVPRIPRILCTFKKCFNISFYQGYTLWFIQSGVRRRGLFYHTALFECSSSNDIYVLRYYLQPSFLSIASSIQILVYNIVN